MSFHYLLNFLYQFHLNILIFKLFIFTHDLIEYLYLIQANKKFLGLTNLYLETLLSNTVFTQC